MNVAIVVLLFGVVRSDISQTNPPPDICLCVDSRNCNVRDSACGDVTDITTTNNCYIYTGQKIDCSESGRVVSYFETNFKGKSGWIEGYDLIYGNGPECGIPDECALISCQNGGKCFNQVDGYICDCAPGFVGIQCEINADECSSDPCQHGGTCTDSVNGYNCTCVPEYTGAHCEMYICLIQLRSYSYNNTPSYQRYAYIRVNGISAFEDIFDGPTPYMRGINTVILNPSRCSAADHENFDTYVSSSSLITYLENLADGTILLGVTCDDPYMNLAPAFPLLLSMGLDVTDVGFRGMFAFVLQKGYPGKTILAKSTVGPDALEMTVRYTDSMGRHN